jgi:hypothetical protein
MKRGSIFFSIIAILVILAASIYWFYLRQTPAEEAPAELAVPANLITLNNFDQLSEIFDNDSSAVRIVALLSPTWPASLRAFSGLREIAANLPDRRLRFYIIWIPIYQTDTWETVLTECNRFQDPRLTYFWDPNRISAITWQQVLNIDQIAWDLYFIYRPGRQWAYEPGPPDFWMRQLKGVIEAPLFDANVFESKIRELSDSLAL